MRDLSEWYLYFLGREFPGCSGFITNSASDNFVGRPEYLTIPRSIMSLEGRFLKHVTRTLQSSYFDNGCHIDQKDNLSSALEKVAQLC